MCGIIGRWSSNQKIDRELFHCMRDTLTHRGPDGFGSYFDPDVNIALGHRRLSFLDLSETGTQPMCNEDRNVWLTINGEIYNYVELRALLIQKGHHFSSSTDSEVLVHAYEEWEMDMLYRIDGMFAFGLWDKRKNKLILARDRFGIKPLYYYVNPAGDLVFASEIKAIIEDRSIKRVLDYESMCNFFTYRYVPSPKTIYKNIYKLPPAHYAEFSAPANFVVKCYYELKTENKLIGSKEVFEKAEELIQDSVKNHIRSEVPVGSFLSGGYDSTTMVACFSQLEQGFNTYSIGFQDWEYSEHQYAQIVADKFRTHHHNKILDNTSLDFLPELMYFYDEPIADISIIPTYFVSKLAAEHNKAVLSGEGADELFAGYTWHRDYLWPVSKKHIRNSKKFGWELPENHFNVESYSRAMSMGLFDKTQLELLLNKDLHKFIPEDVAWFYKQYFNEKIPVPKRFQMLDLKTFMGELVLTKIDRASMANSLEVRVPFLSKEITEFMLSLDPSVYFNAEKQKLLLYKILRKKGVPRKILKRPKQGFTGPDGYYKNIDFYRNYLAESKFAALGAIQQEYLNKLLAEGDFWRLWKITIMELWFRKWKPVLG